MKNLLAKIVLYINAIFLASCGAGLGTTPSYLITFKSGETTYLTLNVDEGKMPVYNGQTPTKENIENGDYVTTYSFSGWSPTLKIATSDASYEATFNEKTSFNFGKYKNNSDSSQLINFLNQNGQSTTEYTEINGKYDDYPCVLYFFSGKSSISYFASYDLFRVVFRSGSDLAITSFKFQNYNSTNSGLLCSINYKTINITTSVDTTTMYGKSPYSFVNNGFYELNVFSCKYGSVILTNK